MAETMTVSAVEELASRLTVPDQLTLVDRLAARVRKPRTRAAQSHPSREEKLRLAKALLAEVSDIADDSQGEFDSAAEIRQMRDERDERTWQSE